MTEFSDYSESLQINPRQMCQDLAGLWAIGSELVLDETSPPVPVTLTGGFSRDVLGGYETWEPLSTGVIIAKFGHPDGDGLRPGFILKPGRSFEGMDSLSWPQACNSVIPDDEGNPTRTTVVQRGMGQLLHQISSHGGIDQLLLADDGTSPIVPMARAVADTLLPSNNQLRHDLSDVIIPNEIDETVFRAFMGRSLLLASQAVLPAIDKPYADGYLRIGVPTSYHALRPGNLAPYPQSNGDVIVEAYDKQDPNPDNQPKARISLLIHKGAIIESKARFYDPELPYELCEEYIMGRDGMRRQQFFDEPMPDKREVPLTYDHLLNLIKRIGDLGTGKAQIQEVYDRI